MVVVDSWTDEAWERGGETRGWVVPGERESEERPWGARARGWAVGGRLRMDNINK